MFDYVFSEGVKLHSRHLLVMVAPNTAHCSRLGLVVAKRKTQGAVMRNRVRRVLKEQFRLNQERLKGCDVVVLLKKPLDTAQSVSKQLVNEWAHCLKRYRA